MRRHDVIAVVVAAALAVLGAWMLGFLSHLFLPRMTPIAALFLWIVMLILIFGNKLEELEKRLQQNQDSLRRMESRLKLSRGGLTDEEQALYDREMNPDSPTYRYRRK